MTSRDQKKMQKKKKREKENRQQTLKRREELRAPAREEREQRKVEKRIDKLQADMAEFHQSFSMDAYKDLDESKMQQLERNVEILRGLESEWQEETDKKTALNKGLEEEGHLTLDEKLRAVSQATIEQQKAEVGMGGSADCRVGAPPKKLKKASSGAGLGTKGGDFAEVSVTKSAGPELSVVRADEDDEIS